MNSLQVLRLGSLCFSLANGPHSNSFVAASTTLKRAAGLNGAANLANWNLSSRRLQSQGAA
jgi:hypothetical protein